MKDWMKNENLKRLIQKKELVVFAGAGVTKSLGLPDWKGFVIDVLKELSKQEPSFSDYVELIQRGNKIKQLCISDVGGDNEANWSCDVSVLDIVFVRPNPDALITADGQSKKFAKIILTDNGDGADENTREVRVQFNGLVFVKNR